MKKLTACAFVLSSLVFALTGCSPASGLCQKQFDCQDQLKLDLDDDYVAVCTAELEGENNVLRKSAEPECGDLADAQLAAATCESALSCDDLVKASTGGDTICKDTIKDLGDKTTAAAGKCDGIADVAAGEGEGEGEG